MKPWSQASSAKGFTLAELLVLVALMALATSLVLQVLLPTLRITSQRSLRVEMQQAAALAVDKMVADLASTNLEGLSLGPSGFAVHPLRGVTGSGEPAFWTEVVAYYHDQASGRLHRHHWQGGPPALPNPPTSTEPLRLTPTTMESLGRSAAAHSLAEDVSRFGLTHAGTTSAWEQPFRIVLELEKGPTRFRLERSVTILNP